MLTARDISRDAFAEHVSEALKSRAREHPHRKVWIGRTADELDVDERTVENWLYGETIPAGNDLAKLFAYFGAPFIDKILEPIGFTSHVSGEYEMAPQGAAETLKALLPVLERLVVDVRTVVEGVAQQQPAPKKVAR